jgi:DNA-binding NtrC family response regulator
MFEGSGPKVLLLDEDQRFATALRRAAMTHGLDLHWYRSLFELGPIGKLGNFDALVAELLIGPVNGLEIAKYAKAFFPGMPVLLVGDQKLQLSPSSWPQSIIGFAPKSRPADEIVALLRTHLGCGQVGHVADASRLHQAAWAV